MPEIAAIIREKGAILLHSAPYASDLILIEFMFKAYKDHLNRYSRDFTKAWDLVHVYALLCVSPQDGLHYFTKTTLTERVEDNELFEDNEVAGAVAAIFMLIYDDEL